MKYLFIGPQLLAGIGQVTNRYAELLESMGHETEYSMFNDDPKSSSYDVGFAFVLPIKEQLDKVDALMSRCAKKNYMTICETDPVSPMYGIFEGRYASMFVSSQFCKDILSRQFPSIEWKILHLYAYPHPLTLRLTKADDKPYIFYTIGNIVDPRKNISMLIRAFTECAFPNARLLLKATCVRNITIQNNPKIIVINGLITENQLNNIHRSSDCYINCSHSEGVGMGAVEAALHSKPVILTDFGGLKEYVSTPFVVKCKVAKTNINDFLFTEDLQWGHPQYEDLVAHMKECYTKRLTHWNHEKTRNLIASIHTNLENSL